MSIEELELEAESRQRVDRWIEESQYLLGRIVPGIIEDRQRQRSRAEAAENACEQFRQETSELRRAISELQGEVQALRTERAEIGHAASAALDHLHQAIHPITEIHQKVQRRNPLEAMPYVAATA